MGTREATVEWLKCSKSFSYFTDQYASIYDATLGVWVPFRLWKEQARVAREIQDHKLVVILKARQLGMTWLMLSYVLWLMLYHPSVTALLFSRRDDEAAYLLERLRGMYKRLPEWMYVKNVVISNAHMWQLSNGSVAYGFPTTAGDSYTASIAVVDEADLVPDLDRLMNAVKPTIDGGGRMILLSRSNKAAPSSTFKRMYRAARSGNSPWHSIFLPWYSRPGRDDKWYQDQVSDSLTRGGLDDLYQQYPATDEEALQAQIISKRIPLEWLTNCYEPQTPSAINGLGLPSLRVYKEPDWRIGNNYVIGADPAEGNPTSDPSSFHVLCKLTGEEVAHFTDRIQPVGFAETIAQVSAYYFGASALVERNNHGHAVIGHLTENTKVPVMPGWDGNPGWHTTTRGKATMWSVVVNGLKERNLIIHSESTFTELNSIDGATLRAPEGLHDDEAISFSLAAIGALGDGDTNIAYSYGNAQQVKKVARPWEEVYV